MIVSSPRRRTPAARLARLLFGCAAVAAIVCILAQLPYGVLREERARIFGEVGTVGVVEAVRSEAVPNSGMIFFIDYKYVDQDGLLRRSSSRVAAPAWRRFSPGSRVRVLYARSQPELARVPGQLFSPFQAWLRRVLE
ncbi:hypothetical protein [Pseudodesulfovibrio sp.]|uniref:hypothetical protein n=1 Tax=Pseudodesulfovibrio sp. TaxID=2035812 RepID=UPI00261872CE|nr:hypothetical protein [Pseudodesulfovibrio sp.]MDD3313333.1 hypothetical protein [Pseudodesulfovibrio sp.]